MVALSAGALAPPAPITTPYRAADRLSITLVTLAAVALLWRRRWPTLAVIGTTATVVTLALAGYETGLAPWGAWIALYACFAHGTPHDRIVGALAASAGVTGYLAFDRGRSSLSVLVGVVLPTLLAGLAGEAIRARRAYAAELEARNTALQRAQALAARQLLLQERTRLARELHDALGHAVNVMVMQAGVADRVFDANPGYGRAALRSIADIGRDALSELDSLLGLLRPEAEQEPEPITVAGPTTVARPTTVAGPITLTDPITAAEPATTSGPSLADLPTTIQRLRDVGRLVDATVSDRACDVPLRVSRTAFRILQEAMTNAARHAGPGRIIVDVMVDQTSVHLDVRDEGGECGPVVPGRGLVNMAERSRMVGGTFEAGPVAGGFRVRATLPIGDGGVR